jgi:hypothetical protein
VSAVVVIEHVLPPPLDVAEQGIVIRSGASTVVAGSVPDAPLDMSVIRSVSLASSSPV